MNVVSVRINGVEYNLKGEEQEEYLLISNEAYENHLRLTEGKKLQEERARSEQQALNFIFAGMNPVILVHAQPRRFFCLLFPCGAGKPRS